MARIRKKLGEILVSMDAVTEDQVKDALAYGMENRKRIGEALVELEMCSDDDVAKALAQQFGIEYINLETQMIPQASLSLIPKKVIEDHKVIPVGQENGRLKVVVTDPLDLETMDLLRFRLNTELTPMLSSPSMVRGFIDQFITRMSDELSQTMNTLSREQSISRSMTQTSMTSRTMDLASALEARDDDEDEDAPIIRLINLILTEAVRGRASDIHVEPMTNRVRVRYRTDGVCQIRDDIPKAMQGAVTTRLKILAGLDIAERRLPQDGRIKMKIGKGNIDFRVSSLPSYHGESVVLRILRPEAASVGIGALGFEEDNYAQFQKIIKRPNGIFLVTGPTGSGKTTTLYSALQELNRPDRKIITAEDPVEYNFTGINQCQVREDIGLTFARILRSMLRQAPNIILVGEIRDKEVGEVAIQAALTGHLVFSTLHTNDAPSAMTRLMDMGIKPFLVASSVQAIMAQRLIRIICPDCRTEDPNPDRKLMRLLRFNDQELEGKTIMKGAGCKRCNGSGYRGRKGIFEMLELNNEIRELAFNRAPLTQLRKAARATGMRGLMEDGKLKILRGITTPEEIARVAQSEDLVALEDD
jgi:type IV pilus assembly protein PilB